MSDYPDLSQASMISFDIETYDPELIEKGAGVYRRDGYILGCSIATDDGFSEYYNLGHRGCDSYTVDRNINYLRSVLGNSVPKIGANIRYDIDWLENFLDIKVKGELNDIQVAEPLLDEYAAHYSLDTQAQKYLGVGKYKDQLEEFCKEHGLKGDPRQHIWQMPYELTRQYALTDAVQPILIFNKQKGLLVAQDLMPLYNMEMKLYRPLLQMKKIGIRVDRNRIGEIVSRLEGKIAEWQSDLRRIYGDINFNSSKQIAALFDHLGIAYNKKLDTGNPNIDKLFLSKVDHPVAKLILDLRAARKVIDTFLLGAFTEMATQGRIHADFVPLKADEGGTVTGRLSCRSPNLQQVPSKEEAYGPETRSAFIPEEDCWYGKIDESQIEYRIIAHYAQGPKSEDVKKAYNADPHTDYHALVQTWIKNVTNVDLERKKVKNLNFGTAYFMGVESMARKFNWSLEMSKELNKVYFDTFPFIKTTRSNVVTVGKLRGYVKTILGRRARVTPYMREQRKEYIIFNHLIQGTAADVMKKSIVDAYEMGLFNVLYPHITVHDELGVSIPKTREGVEAYRELKNVMETCIKFEVPLVAEAEIGPSWGETEACDFDKLLKEV